MLQQWIVLYFLIKSSQSNESNSFTFIDNDTHWVYLIYQIGPLCNALSLRPDTFIHWTNLILGFSPNITHHLGNLILSYIELILHFESTLILLIIVAT